MITIQRATINDATLLATIGSKSFIESHGHSGPPAELEIYKRENYTKDVFENELAAEKNIYHLIFKNEIAAGYSKIILDCPRPEITPEHVTKLERLYLLREFYGEDMGSALFRYNLELSRAAKQSGMWSFVWKENHRATGFYKKQGFQVIGSHDFRISANHSNPNYLMYLQYQ